MPKCFGGGRLQIKVSTYTVAFLISHIVTQLTVKLKEASKTVTDIEWRIIRTGSGHRKNRNMTSAPLEIAVSTLTGPILQ